MTVRYLRFAIGRQLIHAGLRVLPRGRVKDEIYNLLAAWGNEVRAAIGEAQ